MKGDSILALAAFVGALQGTSWWLLDRSKYLGQEEAIRAARKIARSNPGNETTVVHIWVNRESFL